MERFPCHQLSNNLVFLALVDLISTTCDEAESRDFVGTLLAMVEKASKTR